MLAIGAITQKLAVGADVLEITKILPMGLGLAPSILCKDDIGKYLQRQNLKTL